MAVGVSLNAQPDLQFDSLPNTTVSIAPFNQALIGTGNTFYLKRSVLSEGNNVTFLRFGLGFLSGLPNDADASEEDLLSGRSALSFNLGLENSKMIGRMSISLGTEFSYQRIAVDESRIRVNSGSFFSLNGLEISQDAGIEETLYRTAGLTLFSGFRYHINRHFQIGLETALGIGSFRLESTPSASAGTQMDESGVFIDFAAARHLLFEVNF